MITPLYLRFERDWSDGWTCRLSIWETRRGNCTSGKVLIVADGRSRLRAFAAVLRLVPRVKRR